MVLRLPFRIMELEFGNAGFLRRGENRTKTSWSKVESQQQSQRFITLLLHMASLAGFEPGPHRWVAGALSNALLLLP